MPHRDDVPQMVGEATGMGWQWLTARCAFCRRVSRVMLADFGHGERLGSLARRMRCRRCWDSSLIDYKLGMTYGATREKSIAFEGEFARRVGMG